MRIALLWGRNHAKTPGNSLENTKRKKLKLKCTKILF